jgi:hypothetical protein
MPRPAARRYVVDSKGLAGRQPDAVERLSTASSGAMPDAVQSFGD